MSIILLTVDVFVKWFKTDKMVNCDSLVLRFFYYFSLCLAEFVAFVATVTYLAAPFQLPLHVLAAVIMSSFPKLFYVLMVIWDYEELKYSWIVRLFVFTSNVEALSVCLRKSYVYSLGILLAGVASHTLLTGAVMRAFSFA